MTGAPDATGATGASAPSDRAARWEPAVGESIAPNRPGRPAWIEFAASTLIVSGIVRLVAVALALLAPTDAELIVEPVIVVLEIAIQLLTIATGVLVRVGRAWLVVVNLVVILTFIQLISIVGVVSLAFGLLFAVASVAVYLHRPWFEAMAAWRAAVLRERRA